MRAVNDVPCKVEHNEVIAVLGSRGVRESTTISMIRGDIRPRDGDILVEKLTIMGYHVEARASIGVCPQFDAIDEMATEKHLQAS